MMRFALLALLPLVATGAQHAFGARQGILRPLRDAKGVVERQVDQRFSALTADFEHRLGLEINKRIDAAVSKAVASQIAGTVRTGGAAALGAAAPAQGGGAVVVAHQQQCAPLSSPSYRGLQTYTQFIAKQQLGGFRKLGCGLRPARACATNEQLERPFVTYANPLASGHALQGMPRHVCPKVLPKPADDDGVNGRKSVVAAFCGDNAMLEHKMFLPTVFPDVETHLIRMGAGDPVVLKGNERKSVGGGFTAVGAEKLGDGGVPWKHEDTQGEGDMPVPDILMCIGYNYNAALTELRGQYEKANRAERKARRSAGNPVPDGPAVHRGEWHFSSDAAPLFWGKTMKKPAYHFGRMPFMIGMDMEPYGWGVCNQFDVMLTVKLTQPGGDKSIARAHHQPAHTGCPQILMLTALYTMAHRKLHSFRDLLRPPGWATSKELLAEPAAGNHFAAFMYSNCGMVSTSVVRMAFFDLLSDYKHVHALGKCRGETNKGKHKAAVWRWAGATSQQASEKSFYDGAAETFAKYKFTIAFENTQVPGYVTEKLINPYLGRSVPIYWGAPDLEELGFNPKAFIICKHKTPDFSAYSSKTRKPHLGFECYEKKGAERTTCMANMEAAIAFAKNSIIKSGAQSCLDEVKRLDKDDEAYRAKLAEPLLRGNKLEGTAMDPYSVGRAIREVMEQSVDYVAPIQPVKNV
jgi:hypothetical protein